MDSSSQPKWYVYLAVPLLAGLLLLESRLALQSPIHELLQFGIVLLVFGLVYRWVSRASLRCCEDRR